ncbi:hypothetical protein [Gordonia sp. SL306]|uniref:hypothetical protein n=1 Tax=Gordonia sp. SL306 TaxID=2995145 RepID=UPI002270831A|nr:hypothetical protein [Gordonia sp. SL306]WAC56551.1 hypothetical protein OVA31_04645 [Gordonia sp. SL306]
MAGDRLLDDERTARAELRSAVDELRTAEIEAGERRPSRIRWLVAVLTVVAVVAAVVGGTLWVRAEHAYTDSDFQRAAVARVSLLLSPDHRRLDQARRILDGAAGAFYDEFAQSADGYSRFIQSQGTVARGTVDGAGVSGRSGDEAAVLVAATVEFSGDAVAGRAAAIRQFRLRVLVSPDDGQLKLSAVQYIP